MPTLHRISPVSLGCQLYVASYILVYICCQLYLCCQLYSTAWIALDGWHARRKAYKTAALLLMWTRTSSVPLSPGSSSLVPVEVSAAPGLAEETTEFASVAVTTCLPTALTFLEFGMVPTTAFDWDLSYSSHF